VTTRRIFWRLARPVVAFANRLGLCSYKWVNVCALAWRPDLGDALMHHEYFGDRVDSWPEHLTLAGIHYETVLSCDSAVVLVEAFTKLRLTFRRNSAHSWEVSTSAPIMAEHIREAYAWVEAVYGGDFPREYGPEPTLSFFAHREGRESEQPRPAVRINGSDQTVPAFLNVERALTQLQARRAVTHP
jgi:hypothetical protein